jgi:hypothetical protein
MKKLWPALEEHFQPIEGGLQSQRMEKVRREQEEFRGFMRDLSGRGVDARKKNRTVNRTVDPSVSHSVNQTVNHDAGIPLLLRTPVSDLPSVETSSSLALTPPSGPVTTAQGGGGGLSPFYPTPELAEAGFRVFLDKYPAAGVSSEFEAQRAWGQVLPWLPPLAELLPALERYKRSPLARANKPHNIARWLRERMWTGKLGAVPARGEGADVSRQHDEWVNDLDTSGDAA